ncbi:hypothetical protein [Methylobacterium radiotolerans]|uniref:hypothetical protein n=1 Tax=Methylobacterium radiotolerans TaxID=31998 RepID=UPI001F28FC8A|nr:hypothetical protein [Methylobacterium radiotolerans]UIY44149.1 hypothetical protein LZ599_10870 [Methylobacterium radiotolerans]
MATRIQSLFLVQASITIASNEDMQETIAFFENDGVTPIPLDGIEFTAIAKTDRASNAPYVAWATLGAALKLPSQTPRGLFLTSGNLLSFYAPFRSSGQRPIAGSYVFDALASADGLTRRVVDGTLTVIQGVT